MNSRTWRLPIRMRFPYQSPSFVVDLTSGASSICFSRNRSVCVHRSTTIRRTAYSTHGTSGIRDPEPPEESWTESGGDPDTDWDTFLRTRWAQTVGRERPRSRAAGRRWRVGDRGRSRPITIHSPLICHHTGGKRRRPISALTATQVASALEVARLAEALTKGGELLRGIVRVARRRGRCRGRVCSPSSAPLRAR
jgi:hypothetical protein